MKLSLVQVEEVLNKNKSIDESAKKQVLKELEGLSNNEEPKPKPVKKKFVLLANTDKESQKTREIIENIQMFLFQIPEEEDHQNILKNFPAIKNDFNESKNGKKNPAIKNLDIVEYVPAKILKEYSISRKSSEPIIIVPFVGGENI